MLFCLVKKVFKNSHVKKDKVKDILSQRKTGSNLEVFEEKEKELKKRREMFCSSVKSVVRGYKRKL